MILDLIAIAGITVVITTSQLFRPMREFVADKSLFLGRLISCSMCTGVWVGLLFFLVPEFAKSVLHYTFIGSVRQFSL
jgi:hypothetical protein